MRKYYITCIIDGIQEKFKFDNKKALTNYLQSEQSNVLRCGNVKNVQCYSEIVK